MHSKINLTKRKESVGAYLLFHCSSVKVSFPLHSIRFRMIASCLVIKH